MLGPPVCVACKKAYKYLPFLVGGRWWKRWECPECGATDTKDHAATIPKELFDRIFPEREIAQDV